MRASLYNSAAVFQRGSVAGVYRKLYPAIRRSVYEAGREVPVFQVGDLSFGIVICNDSNYSEPARLMAARGATALFVPTNNGLPLPRASVELVAQARKCDAARGRREQHVGHPRRCCRPQGEWMSHGSSESSIQTE